MRSSSQQSGARPSVLIRDRLAEDLIGASIETDDVRDEYPIRHAWTFVIPPTAEQFAASKER
jgi:hypothetical protein